MPFESDVSFGIIEATASAMNPSLFSSSKGENRFSSFDEPDAFILKLNRLPIPPEAAPYIARVLDGTGMNSNGR